MITFTVNVNKCHNGNSFVTLIQSGMFRSLYCPQKIYYFWDCEAPKALVSSVRGQGRSL